MTIVFGLFLVFVYIVKYIYFEYLYCRSEFGRYIYGWIFDGVERVLNRELGGFVWVLVFLLFIVVVLYKLFMLIFSCI